MGQLRFVAKDYQHFPKAVVPAKRLSAGQAQLKWYNLARAEDGVPEAIEGMARAFLAVETQSQRLGMDRELGFVVLHRCGAEFYFLIFNTWRGTNELWETVFYKESSGMPGFSLFGREGRHLPTFCVWELAAVLHEQKAWTRFLCSQRTATDEELYLQDTFSGPA
ncbi:MAG: hypothetical protein ACLPJH_04440 [Myxococcaceae bacterium]